MSTENNERPVVEQTLSNGVVVTYFEYMSGRDRRSIEDIMTSQAKVSRKTDTDQKTAVEMTGISGTVGGMMQDKTIQVMIKEIKAGENIITDKNKILDFVLDSPEYIFNEVLVKIESLTKPKKM